MNKKWILLDCSYICHKVIHTMDKPVAENDVVGVVFGFLSHLLYLEEKFRTPNFVFCWDSKHSIREEMYPEYKSVRHARVEEKTEEDLAVESAFRKQIRRLRTRYIPTIGYRNSFCQKGYEADDMMAAVIQDLPEGDEAVLVTSDQDMYQLLSLRVSIYNSVKGINLKKFKKTYGISPKQWSEVKAIGGCSSDSIKGVGGVGEITALRYLRGELKETHKTYCTIVSDKGKRIIKRNTALVKLPLKGTRKCLLVEDELSKKGWDKVVKFLDMYPLADKYPGQNKRKGQDNE
jgi:5'-3' exonuclease